MSIAFRLPVCPKSIQFAGKRVMVRAGRPVFFANKDARLFAQKVDIHSRAFRPQKPLEGPVSVYVSFVIQRPKALMGKKHLPSRIPAIKRPDLDNLVKGLLDALQGFWIDDSQIVELHLIKAYAAKEEDPHIYININEYTGVSTPGV
jgi:Holliday junction resolvase RusA-like endonuclease